MPTLTQADVDRYFASSAAHWDDIYEEATVRGVIFQERQVAVLRFIDALNLPSGSAVIDIGAGSGRLSVALARRGLNVTAVDTVEEMIRRTEMTVARSGFGNLVKAQIADVRRLPFADASFSLVAAVGVLNWMDSQSLAIGEMARVLRPGGFMVVTADNVRALNLWLDPRLIPPLAPVRRLLGRWLRSHGLMRRSPPSAVSTVQSGASVTRRLSAAGLVTVRTTTVGFGPFTSWTRQVFSTRSGIWLHHQLQNLAQRHPRVFDQLGAHHLVLARKPVVGQTSAPGSEPHPS